MRWNMAPAASARHASARSAARLVAAPLVALLIMVFCNNAYAEVDWHEKGANMSATVSPWSYPEGRAYALSEFLGYDWGSLSTDVRDKILTDSNGDNAFKAILDHNVLNVQYESGDGALNWPIINIWSTVFGLDKCWDISTTNERYTAAREVMKKYMFPSSGDSGGGESGETTEYGSAYHLSLENPPYKDMNEKVTVYNTFTVSDGTEGKKTLHTSGGSVARKCNDVSEMVMYVDEYTLNKIRNYVTETLGLTYDEGNITFIRSWTGTYCFYATGEYEWVKANVNNNYYIKNNSDTALEIYTWTSATNYLASDGNNVCVFMYGGTYYNKKTIAANSVGSNYPYAPYWTNDGSGGSGGGGDEPYVPVPKEDPTRPVVQIGDVTVDLSNGPYTVNNTTYSVVYAPDNSWSIQVETPDEKVYSGDIVATETSDYSGVLDAILRAINAFRQEVLGYYNDIDADLTTLTNSLNTSLKNVETTLDADIKNMRDQLHSDIGTLQDNLQRNFNGKMDAFAADLWANIAALDSDLMEEIYKDAKYIVDNLNFNADFDDSGIVKWLKKIYLKLQRGPSGIRDPTEDPKGWFDDLEDVLRKLLEGFLTGFNTAELASLMDQLKDRFPISIPWDVLAMIKLFEGEAVTPSVDWPIYNGDTLITEIQMDFSMFDNVARITRKLSLIAFGMVLAVNTKFLMNTTTTVTRRNGGGD